MKRKRFHEIDYTYYDETEYNTWDDEEDKELDERDLEILTILNIFSDTGLTLDELELFTNYLFISVTLDKLWHLDYITIKYPENSFYPIYKILERK